MGIDISPRREQCDCFAHDIDLPVQDGRYANGGSRFNDDFECIEKAATAQMNVRVQAAHVQNWHL